MNLDAFLIIAMFTITLVNLYMFISFKFCSKKELKIDKDQKFCASNTYKLEPNNNKKI